MTALGALLGRSEQRAIQATAWGDWGDSGTTWSGASVTAQNSIELLTVYGCNRFICDGISTLPVDVFRKNPDGSTVSLPTPRLLEEPAPDLDFISWSTQFLTSLLLGGDFFGFVARRDATVTAVVPLDPTKVQPFRRGGRKAFLIEGQEFDNYQILHVPAIMWPGSERGLSPVEAARQSIGVGKSSQEYAARFFGDDSTPPGVIEIPTEVDPGLAKDMARSWAKAHSGKSNRRLPGVLQGGAQWKPTAVTNEQAQFLQTRKFTAAEIAANLFLIDPSEMGIGIEGQSLTYANLEQRNARKVQVTFLPWIVRLEKALSSLIAKPRFVKLNVDGLLRGDTLSRYQAHATGIGAKFLTPNEARELEDLPPLDGGDEFPAAEPAVRSLVRTVDRDDLGQITRVVEQSR